jgi:hypothetical protein
MVRKFKHEARSLTFCPRLVDTAAVRLQHPPHQRQSHAALAGLATRAIGEKIVENTLLKLPRYAWARIGYLDSRNLGPGGETFPD